ncbi:MAG: hypothetical protein U5J96_17440 [Ignavibacteriaceae bacterium]|nr:hypothetical protein [Ignavibacteriaceae bacterium]
MSSDVLNTDPSGSNLYSGSISGPIIPGIPEHTIFLSGERGWYRDADPPAVPLEFYTLEDGTILDEPIVYETIPNNPAGVWRFSGKLNSRFSGWNVQLSALLNNRISKTSKGGNSSETI